MTLPSALTLPRRALPLAAALALGGAAFLTSPALAQNPLGRNKAPAARPFVGTFTGKDVKLELRWNDKQSNYTGKLTVDDESMTVEATERAGVLAGKFRADGEDYEFTLQARGAKFVLKSEDEEHELERQGGKPEATAPNGPQPGQNPPIGGPEAPGGVGIAFQAQDGKLVVAQLAPQSPAEKAKVPLGAILRAVDGKRIEGLEQEAVRALIRGKVGTLVTVTLETDTEVLDVVLQRAVLAGNGPAPVPVPQPPLDPNGRNGRNGQNGQNGQNGPRGLGGGEPGQVADGTLLAWMKVGMRATWFSGSASIPGVSSTLVEDDDGDWIDGQGRKYSKSDVASSGGAGFTQYDFVQVSPECIAVANTNFVFADAQLATVQRASTAAFVGDQNGLGDVWIHPAKLRAMREEQSPGYRVRRVRYPLDGRTYDAITTQTTSQGSFLRYTYDLDTGLLLVHSSSSVGKGMVTPNANGTASQGAGTTMIAHGHLRSLRELQLPWLGQTAPKWLQTGQQLQFSGTYGNSLAEGLMAPWRYGFTVGIDRQVGGAFLATLTTRLDYGTGQPPQEGKSQVVYGPGSATNLWLDPRSIQNLKQGQVLDRDPITNCQVMFAGSDGQTATIVEQGPLESQSYTYDLRSGQLVATSVRQKSGPATLAIDVQLVR